MMASAGASASSMRGAGIEPVQSLPQAREACSDPSTRSVLARTIRSATAACFTRFAMRIERGGAVDRIDHRHHAFDRVAHRQIGMIEHRVQDRRRIGETGGLDDDAPERQ